MKLKITATILLVSLSHFSFAASAKPESCPSISALQALGVTHMVQEKGLWYGAVPTANYGTNDNWTFTIGHFKAKREDEARDKAINALSSLSFEQGPVALKIEGHDSWVCLYRDKAGHTAGTITPTMNIGSQLLKF